MLFSLTLSQVGLYYTHELILYLSLRTVLYQRKFLVEPADELAWVDEDLMRVLLEPNTSQLASWLMVDVFLGRAISRQGFHRGIIDPNRLEITP